MSTHPSSSSVSSSPTTALVQLLELAGFTSDDSPSIIRHQGSGGSQPSQRACLTLRVPDIPAWVFDRWLGPRLAWWSHGVPTRPRAGVASSRLSRALDLHSEWFDGWRAACREIAALDEVLVAVSDTMTGRFARRAAELFQVPWLEVEIAEASLSIAQWLRDVSRGWDDEAPRSDTLSTASSGAQLRLSPCLPPHLAPSISWTGAAEQPFAGLDIPVADRALVLLSQRLVVLHQRRRGQLAQLLDARRAETMQPPIVVRPAATLGRTDARSREMAPDDEDASRLPLPARIVDRSSLALGLTLSHCTRRHDGPWPDQSEEEFLTELLLDQPAKDRSALAVLRRIVTTRRLLGSAAAIRGRHRVVGFTSVALNDLPRLRTFRSHRHRWDFEPYGLCIDRDWLVQRGARPVHYGDDADWRGLNESERPFFQLAHGRVERACSEAAQWRDECEWRVVGDVVLTDLPADAAVAFVPTESEARQLAPFSPWPIAVLS